MSAVPFSQFLPEIITVAVGCPDPTAINAVRNAAIDFCTKTKVWQQAQDPVWVSALALPLDLEADAGMTVVQVRSCKADGLLLSPVTVDYLDATYPNWEDATGTPRFFYQLSGAQVGLYPLPTTSVSLRLRVAVAPTRAAAGIDAEIYQQHLPTLAFGALAALLVLPAAPWADAKLALYYRALYDEGVIAALALAQKSFTRAHSRVLSSPF